MIPPPTGHDATLVPVMRPLGSPAALALPAGELQDPTLGTVELFVRPGRNRGPTHRGGG
jgi:hypothetical protein